MVVREVVHAVFAGVFIFGIYYDLFVVRFPEAIRRRHMESGGRLKYLTFWNMLLQAGFFILSFVNDIVLRVSNNVSSENKRGKLQRFLDNAYAVILFPVGLFVSCTFWAVYIYDRELMFPRIFDAFFPAWLNHLMHTFICITVLIEMSIVRHVYPWRKFIGFVGTMIFFAVYLIWIHVIVYLWDFWTYPLLEALDIWQRLAFFGGCLLTIAIIYFLGDFLNVIIWGRGSQGRKEKPKKSKAKKKKTT